ncbi:DUF2871 domain-containing protein [Thermocaproicibacter melissae]|uniref:DUF2871 domain-containing protein n=1 Tax=Thermocaproicibacter melissae TaxID=2966552 RepID=UPI0024B07A7C|nr:DUF2871 domain-containing protein [Thermocaproicibacter melissae]WBY63354.1 DUF2871 domain-containing protein [Thermocaproicibacter melissae]
MKRIARFSFFYCILGMLLGVFYREFTKINHFTGQTVLSGLHTHVLVLGALFLLILLLLEKSFALTENKKFNLFFITYNIGLFLTVIMMAIRGCVEVLNLEISSAINSTISGVAGLGHIIMMIAYILFFLILLHGIKDAPQHPSNTATDASQAAEVKADITESSKQDKK